MLLAGVTQEMRLSLFIARLRLYLGLEHNVVIMTAARIVKGFGSGLWSQYLPKVLEAFGASAPMIGLFGTINSGLSTVFSYLGGALSDRLGRGRAMIFSAVVSLAGYLVYAVSPTWWLFIPGATFLTASVSFAFMGSMAMTGETLGENRRAVSMASRGLISLPFALIAPPVGGLLINRLGIMKGFRVSIVVTILLSVLSILIQRKLYKLPPPAVKKISLNIKAAWASMGIQLRYLLFANCLMSFGSGMSTLFLVLYAMNILGISAVHYGVLQSVLIASSSLLSIPIGKLSDRKTGHGRKPFAAMAFLLIAIYPFLVVIAPSGSWLLPIFILRGVRETFDLVRKAMIIDLAGCGERGRAIGLYFFIIGITSFPASFIAGWLWQWRPTAPFLIGGAISMLGFILFLSLKPSNDAVHLNQDI
jgi:MFS family permease